MTTYDFTPITERLIQRGLYQLGDAVMIDSWTETNALSIILLSSDPIKHPEVADSWVIIPELCDAFKSESFQCYFTDLTESQTIAQKYHAIKFPALLFFYGSHCVDAINGLQDWAFYVEKMVLFLQNKMQETIPTQPIK